MVCLAQDRPNIVFLLADDMSRDTWGVYGSVDCKTPHIDQLAQEGMTLQSMYASVAMCAPFRQELYSGRTPWRTGTLANHSKSTEGTRSLPHYLKPLGYQVALIGKSHVGPQSAYPFQYINTGNKKRDSNEDYLKAARKVIDQSVEKNAPFCIFIASNDSHAPFTTGNTDQYKAENLTIPPYWIDTPALRETLVKYYAEISNFDKLVGSVRNELENRGLWENTLFIVCSEQGTQLPFAKWTCYDNGLRSGMVIHWPGVIAPKSSSDALLSIADVAPTLVHAAGGSFENNDFDGSSFLKTLKGNTSQINEYVYGAFTNCNIIQNRERVFPIRVIRNRDYSLIYNPNHTNQTANLTLMPALKALAGSKPDLENIGASWVAKSQSDPQLTPLVHKLHNRPEFEFYDLSRDPYELNNQIGNPEYASVIEAMKTHLMEKLDELGDSDPIETEKSLVRSKKKSPNS